MKMRYSIEPRDRIYVKGYGFLSFAKNMGKILIKNTVKSVLIALKILHQAQQKQHRKKQFKKQQNQLLI